MSETRERSALEVLRRFNQLVDERHLVVMGPQDLTDPLWDDIEALLEPTPASDGGEVRGDAPAGATLYRRRCGWCGAYEGTVDPKEPCATDEIGYIGPHQFEVLEAVVSGSGSPPGEGERGLIMRAMLETFPWSPDIRQEHFERAADAVIAALRSESPEAPSGEGKAVRVPGAVERPCDCAGCHCANVGDAEEVGYADGWNACRDAMLAALRPETAETPRGEGEGMYADLPLIDRVAHQLANIAFWELEREDYPSVRRELVQRFSAALAALRSAPTGAEDRATPTDRSESDERV